MTMANRGEAQAVLPPLVIARTFRAPRELVFRAWSSAEHIRRWFCPAQYSVPEATVDFRPGGAFDVCMRSEAGQEHWSRGKFVEIDPHHRLVFQGSVMGDQGQPLFDVHTVVRFTDAPGASARDHATTMEVTQHYTLLDPAAAGMTQGAPEGWRQTLDRLEAELERSGCGTGRWQPEAGRSVVHAVFTLERTFRATPAQVFHALTDPTAKAKWFAGGGGYTLLAREMDVRPGGREHVQGRWESGMVSTFDAIYLDIVPDQRLLYTYTMHLDDRKISVSQATFELHAAGQGTRVVLTEQGAFLDGYDDAGSREGGTAALLEALRKAVEPD